MEEACTVSIVLKKSCGGEVVLKEGIKLEKGEVIDAATLNVHDL